MAKPSEKTEVINQFIKDMFGIDRVDAIRQGVCVAPPIGCGREGIENEFKDDWSRKEYAISGLCQRCQDELFEEAMDDLVGNQFF